MTIGEGVKHSSKLCDVIYTQPSFEKKLTKLKKKVQLNKIATFVLLWILQKKNLTYGVYKAAQSGNKVNALKRQNVGPFFEMTVSNVPVRLLRFNQNKLLLTTPVIK